MAVTPAPNAAPESQDSLAAEYIKQNPSANPMTASTALALQPSATATPTNAPESQDSLAAAYATQEQAKSQQASAAQIKYKQDTAAGPFTKPGAAEAATDVRSPEALQNMAIGAGATLGAPIAAPLAASVMAGEAPAILKEISRQALEYANGKAEIANESLSKVTNAYPELSKLVGKMGFGKTAGTLGIGYGSWELFKHITGLGGK
jgi:hypothetical protein